MYKEKEELIELIKTLKDSNDLNLHRDDILKNLLLLLGFMDSFITGLSIAVSPTPKESTAVVPIPEEITKLIVDLH